MRLREHTATACLLTIIICVSASLVAAQDYMQPPFVPAPVGTPTLMAGRFYFQAGARYRSVDTLRFNVHGGPLSLTFLGGTVPFGPTEPGNFGVGTGRPGFTGGAGNSWVYDNGQISGDVVPPDPTIVPLPALAVGCDDTILGPIVCNSDDFWTYSVLTPELGRYLVTINGSGTCCDGQSAPSSIGSFSIVDPSTQVNNFGGPIANTTTVTFQRLLADSLLFNVTATTVNNRVLDPQVWSPVFETGFQLYDFFDIFYGFSWFNVSNSMGIANPLVGLAARRILQDTFPFLSDDTTTWPIFNFNSSNSVVNGDALHNYRLATNGPGQGILPNRQFISQQDDTLVPENIQELISNSADITVYEARMGSRTWVPLYGMGRLGATMGFAFMPAYYKIAGNRNYISQGPNLPAGTSLLSQSALYKDWMPHYGAFVGGDLTLAYGAAYFNAAMDYTWATVQKYQLFTVETSFSPGGMTVGLFGGVRF